MAMGDRACCMKVQRSNDTCGSNVHIGKGQVHVLSCVLFLLS